MMEEECEDLPVWVNGTQRWVTGLTRRTTADDVIYALLYNDGLQELESTEDFAIFERWRQVERPLQARTKILKIWRAWGEEQPNVQLSMRRLDDYFMPGDHPRSRRRRRSRHRHSRQCRHSPLPDPARVRSAEALVRLVVSQERRIQELMDRLRATDQMIESYETKVHQQRSRQNGTDYVQAAYLDSLSEDSMEDFLSAVDKDQLDQYLDFCDQMVTVEGELVAKQATIEDLSAQIDQSLLEDGSRSSGSSGLEETMLSADPSTLEAELEQTQVQINRLASANMLQRYEEMQLASELEQVERQLCERQRSLEVLERQLAELDKAEAAGTLSEATVSQQAPHHQLPHHHQLSQHQLPPHQVPQHHHQLPQHQLPQHQLPQNQMPPPRQNQDPRLRQWGEGQQTQHPQQYGSSHRYPQSVRDPLHVQGCTDSLYSDSLAAGAGGGRGDGPDCGDYTYLAEEASSPDSGVGVGGGPQDPRDDVEDDAVGQIQVLDSPPSSTSSPPRPSRPRITRKTHRGRSRSRSRNREESWRQSALGSVSCDGPEGAYHVPSASVRDTSRSRDEENDPRASGRGQADEDADRRRQWHANDESRGRSASGLGNQSQTGDRNGLYFRWDWDDHYNPSRSYLSQIPREDIPGSAVSDKNQHGVNEFRRDKLWDITNTTVKSSQTSHPPNQAKHGANAHPVSESATKDAFHLPNGAYADKYLPGLKQNGLSLSRVGEKADSEKNGILATPRIDPGHKGSVTKSVHFLCDGTEDESADDRRAGEHECFVQIAEKGLPPPYSWHCSRAQSSLGGEDPLGSRPGKDDSDSNSDTGLSSMHSDEAPYLETLV